MDWRLQMYGSRFSSKLALATLTLLFLCSVARAEEDWAAREQRQQAATAAFATAQSALTDARLKLEAKPRLERSESEINAYLICALDYLNAMLQMQTYAYGNQPYAFDYECSNNPSDWPGNPLDIADDGSWRPIQTFSPYDSFRAGSLVWQVAPPEHYSWHRGWPQCSSYQLSISGSSVFAAASEELRPAPGNEVWALIPPGSLATRGRHGPGYVETADCPDLEAALAWPAKEAWRRQAAQEYYNRELAAVSKGPNFDKPRFLDSLGSTLEHEQRAYELRRKMQAQDPRLWTAALTRDYLQSCGWQIYMALVAAHASSFEGIDSMADLQASALIRNWPLNPFNGWQPMRVLALEDGFCAGDMVLQSAPLEFNSHLRTNLGFNFVLSVYGPHENYTPGNLTPVGLDKQLWAVSPPGAAGNYAAGSSELLQLAFRRAFQPRATNRPEMLWPDGSPRRMPKSMATATIEYQTKQLSEASPADRARALQEYQQGVVQALYIALELYKYEQGKLPADLHELAGTDYLDAWPGDPVAALSGQGEILLPFTWPPLCVLGPGSATEPGCLLYEPGVAGQAQWVKASLSSPDARPDLSYRLTLYGSDPGLVAARIEAPALTHKQMETLRDELTRKAVEANPGLYQPRVR
jgi:hypothetical protein